MLVTPSLKSTPRLVRKLQTRLARRRNFRAALERLEDRNLLATLYWDPNGATTGLGGSGVPLN